MNDPIYNAFEALKTSGLAQPEVWKPIYQAGLKEALQLRRLDDAAELAVFAAVCLESQGHYDEAIAELEFAAARASTSPDVTANLLGTLANLQAIRGDIDAFDALAAASALVPHLQSEEARQEHNVEQAIVDCIFLAQNSVDEARIAGDNAQAAGFAWLARGLDIWAIPAMVAHGHRRRAVPWVNALAAHAEVDNSAYRSADAAALEFALASTQAIQQLNTEPFERARRNNMAAWRAQVAVLHNAVRSRNAEAAAQALEHLDYLGSRLNAAHVTNADFSEELAEALIPPPTVTLVNLPAVLAAMEVIATRGTQEHAVQWAQWAQDHLPTHIHTALEWPASVARIRALLLVRIGKERTGIALMQRALNWCKTAGYPLEHALCEVQLSELLALGPAATPERRWSTLRRSGRATLREAGIDPLPHSFAATEALAYGRAAEAEPKLSPREVEVLGLLADGLTYKEVGHRLHIEWRTAQVHARRIYAKLGVSGKVRATTRARELGIIE